MTPPFNQFESGKDHIPSPPPKKMLIKIWGKEWGNNAVTNKDKTVKHDKQSNI